MLNEQLEKLTLDDKKQLCDLLQKAREVTLVDMGKLVSQNSRPTRFWDQLNTILSNNEFCRHYLVKRGPWQMVVLLKDGIIYTLMRESRFKEIQKAVKKDRRCQNYANLLAQYFNINIKPTYEQGELFASILEGESEDTLKLKVEQFLRSLYEDGENITNHIIVLFTEESYGLADIRQVIVDKCFEIAEEDAFGELIVQHPSVVMDSATEDNTKSVDDAPAQVKLKEKGLKRKA